MHIDFSGLEDKAAEQDVLLSSGWQHFRGKLQL
jgi:hypothetical protein